MSKKRTLAESNNDQPTTEGSDVVSRHEDNVKRAKLHLLSDTTLQDLPNEVIECILVKAVAMEVNSVVKTLRTEKTDSVINRHQMVSHKWSNLISTTAFRNEVNKVLDFAAPEAIVFKRLDHFPVNQVVFDVTTMKDEIFMLCRPNGTNYAINVYDRNNMAEVKDVIPLPGVIQPWGMAACSMMDCLYILDEGLLCSSVFRIRKVDEHSFELSTFLSNLNLAFPLFSVSANGSLVILSRPVYPELHVIDLYNADGSFQYSIPITGEILKFRCILYVMQTLSGNIIVVSVNGACQTQLTELDPVGGIVRQFQSCLKGETNVTYADICGRLLLIGSCSRVELLDANFNLMTLAQDKSNEKSIRSFVFPSIMTFNRDRDEILSIPVSYFSKDSKRVMSVYRIINR